MSEGHADLFLNFIAEFVGEQQGLVSSKLSKWTVRDRYRKRVQLCDGVFYLLVWRSKDVVQRH